MDLRSRSVKKPATNESDLSLSSCSQRPLPKDSGFSPCFRTKKNCSPEMPPTQQTCTKIKRVSFNTKLQNKATAIKKKKKRAPMKKLLKSLAAVSPPSCEDDELHDMFVTLALGGRKNPEEEDAALQMLASIAANLPSESISGPSSVVSSLSSPSCMQDDSSYEKEMSTLTMEPPIYQEDTMEDMLLKQQAMAMHFLMQQASQSDPECGAMLQELDELRTKNDVLERGVYQLQHTLSVIKLINAGVRGTFPEHKE